LDVVVVDLNCDVGEGYGAWTIGADRELMSVITSANVACGFHAGDPGIMRATVELARRHRVAVGAHPGYPDRQGFGRRRIDLAPAEIEDAVLYQIGALYAFTRSAGVALTHVKPHGALYNFAARDQAAAEAIARAVRSFSSELILVGLAGSCLVEAAGAAGIPSANEAFVDRAYAPDGSLRSRTLPGAVLTDPQMAIEQAVGIVRDGKVRTPEGSIAMRADTLCLHGDTPGAAQLARAVREGLISAGVRLRSLKDVACRP
jgi:UPF0271 protein